MRRFSMLAQSVFFIALFLMPLSASAAVISKPFEISGWIPYWRTATGTMDAMQHLDVFTEINPFVYTVKLDGTLNDAGKMGEEPWLSLQKAAQAKKIRYIPTVMWSNADAMHRILSKQKTRIALEDEITALVKEKGFDGIDIDFEGKKAETSEYFSTFLKGLYQRMGKKWVMCTIESRTPVSDRYFGATPPKDAGIYSNDFVAINKYCDRVRIMAYDQMGIDQQLVNKHEGELYAPVADPEWVEKTVKLAAKTISKKKIVIGIPTYGYEYDVTAYADGYIYNLLWSFNPGYAWPIAQAFGVTPMRSSSGEMSFSYMATSSVSVPVAPDGTTTPIFLGGQAAATALFIASSTNSHSTFRYMVWSDAKAIADKVALAKKLGVRGVAIFKIDGGEDPAMWGVLKDPVVFNGR
ncbi:MAG: glycosyl hydrolase family 18 protein [bacterium]|nr:glycosyl hydrolase family 18 protein [bacterium]